ncbi:MAG: acetyl-CoA carboxylase biotin carboxylase subunit [Chloroflexota bacterium]|nr:acetyl-CoA carboxylase biotin carboxylase subunit [Chloroflexota bacterium]
MKKVLVANRGEIAVRVLRACRELGLQTVAVYSDVDRNALHVRYADEAYPIGPASARESYLCIDRIIEAAELSGADAIHPGYGFLAEQSEFAQACRDAGLIFVGPRPETLAMAGDKAVARRIMREVGVPIIKGTDKELSDEDLVAAAHRIGTPLKIKPAAGGGGKGMRTLYRLQDLNEVLSAARREAEAAFGDGTLYLEKMMEDARHIEFQILADHHGNTIHLGERECSIQRRHQKVIEEAPSRAITPELRQRMGEMAVRVAKTADYTNAGTVEFLLDKEGNFYFLEMNCRLQVEHPITEMITGVDIVKEQLRVASGRKLRYRQEDIQQRGWALECRILAEDPYDDFMPSTGRITGLHEPTGPGVRVDSGIYEGFDISLYYDSLIAKLAVWGETRGEALLRMRRALEEYRVMGVRTNIPFHQQILNDTRFIGGQIDTTFLESGFSMAEEDNPNDVEVAAIAAVLLAHRQRQRTLSIIKPQEDQSQSNWRRRGRWEAVRR